MITLSAKSLYIDSWMLNVRHAMLHITGKHDADENEDAVITYHKTLKLDVILDTIVN